MVAPEPRLFVRGVGDLPIAVYDFGGVGPPLVLMHATGFHGVAYRPMAAVLAGHFHVWAMDGPVHGRSGGPPIPAGATRLDDLDPDAVAPVMGWDVVGTDLLRVIDELALDRPFGFGHSAGGASLLMAEEQAPGTFRAICCYEPVVLPAEVWKDAASQPALAESALRRRPTFDSYDAAVENFAAKPPMNGFDPAALRDYVEGGFAPAGDGTVTLRCRPEAESASYLMATRNRGWEDLGRIAAPVTVLCGGPGKAHFGIDAARAVAAQIPHGRARELASLSHFGPLEDPALVARVVIESFAD